MAQTVYFLCDELPDSVKVLTYGTDTDLAPAAPTLASLTNAPNMRSAAWPDSTIANGTYWLVGFDSASTQLCIWVFTIDATSGAFVAEQGVKASADGGGTLTQQQIRDAQKLAPSAGDPAAGSIDKHLDDIESVASGQSLITPIVGSVETRSTSNTAIALFTQETDDITVTVVDDSGNAVDLSSYSSDLTLIIEGSDQTDIQVETNPTISGDDNNQFTFTPDTWRNTAQSLNWALRRTSTGYVFMRGTITVTYAEEEDS